MREKKRKKKRVLVWKGHLKRKSGRETERDREMEKETGGGGGWREGGVNMVKRDIAKVDDVFVMVVLFSTQFFAQGVMRFGRGYYDKKL